jgi:hypothetical protein
MNPAVRGSLGLALLVVASCRYSDWTLGGEGADGGGPAPDGGGTDAVSSVDGGGVPPFDCTGALFCERFESGSMPSNWDAPLLSPTGVMEVQRGDDVPSPPFALFAKVESDGSSRAYSGALITRTLDRASLKFSFRVEQADPAKQALVAALRFSEGTAYERTMRLFVGAEESFVEDRALLGVVDTFRFRRSMAKDQFTRVSISIDRDRNLEVKMGTDTVVNALLKGDMRRTPEVRFNLGIIEMKDTEFEPFAFRIDDVRVDGS